MFGNFNSPMEGGGGSGSIAVLMTRYFSPHVRACVSVAAFFYTGQDYSTGDNQLKLTPFMGFFATYNFLTANGKVMPYVGGEYSFSWVEIVEPTLAGPIVTYEGLLFAGGKAGLKIFLLKW